MTGILHSRAAISDMPAYQGHTLLELVIALALGLILTCTGLSLYQSQHVASERMEERARMTEAGFAALHLLSAHLRLSGFSAPPGAPFGAALFGCSAGRPVSANNSSGGSVCQPDRAIRSDSLEVRYVADSISTWPASNGKPTDCLGQAIPATQTPESSRAFAINRFFVRKSPASGQNELSCEGSGRRGVAQPLVEGIEHLSVRYQLAGSEEWLDARALQPEQWNTVMAVELCVQVSGTRSATPLSYLDCDGARATPPDARLRQTFTRQIALRNQLLRK
ncbi:Putative type IV pilus protein [Candidatus Glomeribacter gigasporarum BEG34]|uniref:Putative type IV pilus protein n=2 Tax=Candidatus Glomeribacter gigasporarum TaxID=132144 RepID=G2J8C2_9BURK|nr:Putative type IV pilus protein [Candidatus Glomeribacter gigasporarum BEG34]